MKNRSFWRQVLAALTHSGPAYHPGWAADIQRHTDMRDGMAALADAWQQIADATENTTPAGTNAELDAAHKASVRVHRQAADDLRYLARTGHLPWELMDPEDAAERAATEDGLR